MSLSHCCLNLIRKLYLEWTDNALTDTNDKRVAKQEVDSSLSVIKYVCSNINSYISKITLKYKIKGFLKSKISIFKKISWNVFEFKYESVLTNQKAN